MEVSGWVIKGVRSWMDDDAWKRWLEPGYTGRFLTRRTVNGIVAGAPAFLFRGAPASILVAEGRLTGEVGRADNGYTAIGITVDRVFREPLPKRLLLGDPILREAAFVKRGPVGTFYRLTDAQIARIRAMSGQGPQLG